MALTYGEKLAAIMKHTGADQVKARQMLRNYHSVDQACHIASMEKKRAKVQEQG